MRDMVTANGIIEPLIRLVDMSAPVSPAYFHFLSTKINFLAYYFVWQRYSVQEFEKSYSTGISIFRGSVEFCGFFLN